MLVDIQPLMRFNVLVGVVLAFIAGKLIGAVGVGNLLMVLTSLAESLR